LNFATIYLFVVVVVVALKGSEQKRQKIHSNISLTANGSISIGWMDGEKD
jgi:hypothetical protein